MDATAAALRARASFITELARRLHQYGTSAHRLEGAVMRVAERLELDCQILSTPTSIVLSLRDLNQADPWAATLTQIVRLGPGSLDLGRLAKVDEIAEKVMREELPADQGRSALLDIASAQSPRLGALVIPSYGVASAAVTVLLGGDGSSIVAAGFIGLLIGALAESVGASPALGDGLEAIAALVATLATAVISAHLVPIAIDAVIVASLIVLLPGLGLTIAVTELSTSHLISGSARFAGAVASLLKLAFGVVLGHELIALAAIELRPATPVGIDPQLQIIALAMSALAFAVLFKAALDDIPLVATAVLVGYAATQIGGLLFRPDFAGFFAALIVAALANTYARWRRRPGALVRLPGIILLVPGSVGFRSLGFVFEREVEAGLSGAFSLVIILVGLVAGLLFGNLLVPPRRDL